MHRSTFTKWIVVLIIATLATAAPASASCSTDACVSPCNYAEVLYDTNFTQNCPYWVFTTNTQRVLISGDYWAELNGSGSVSQQITLGTYSSMQIAFEFDAQTNTYTGTERLSVDIVRASDGAILQTVATLYPSSTPGRYDYNISNYSGQTVKLRFRWGRGVLDPGDTTFRISWAEWWSHY